jgi:hypothetical protein
MIPLTNLDTVPLIIVDPTSESGFMYLEPLSIGSVSTVYDSKGHPADRSSWAA